MPDTLLISATEFSANFARYEAEAAEADVVKIVRDGLVVGGYLSARELARYEQLKRREAEVLRVGELPPDVVADIEAAEVRFQPAVTLPPPRVGLVVRYAFLWSHETSRETPEARKDRPCAVVVATQREGTDEVRVIVAPITHRLPADPSAAIELPDDVKRLLGLDAERQWLCFDELNRFTWPGFDLRPLPGR